MRVKVKSVEVDAVCLGWASLIPGLLKQKLWFQGFLHFQIFKTAMMRVQQSFKEGAAWPIFSFLRQKHIREGLPPVSQKAGCQATDRFAYSSHQSMLKVRTWHKASIMISIEQYSKRNEIVLTTVVPFWPALVRKIATCDSKLFILPNKTQNGLSIYLHLYKGI